MGFAVIETLLDCTKILYRSLCVLFGVLALLGGVLWLALLTAGDSYNRKHQEGRILDAGDSRPGQLAYVMDQQRDEACSRAGGK